MAAFEPDINDYFRQVKFDTGRLDPPPILRSPRSQGSSEEEDSGDEQVAGQEQSEIEPKESDTFYLEPLKAQSDEEPEETVESRPPWSQGDVLNAQTLQIIFNIHSKVDAFPLQRKKEWRDALGVLSESNVYNLMPDYWRLAYGARKDSPEYHW